MDGIRDKPSDEEAVAVDFFSLLPAELLLHISLSLSPSDVTLCLLVCRAWCSRLCQLEPYWHHACRTIGLSGYIMRKSAPLHKTSRELFLSAQNYLRGLSAPPPTTINLTRGYPYNVRYSYQYARHGCIIGTLYRDFKPREMVVETVKNGELERTHNLQLAFESRPENRIVWGHLLLGGVYVCATASGRWSLYDIRTPATAPVPPLRTWVGDPLYDTDIRLGCCERCGLVATARLVSFHSMGERSYWDLRFVNLPLNLSKTPTHTLRFKLYHGNKDIVGRRVPYGKRKVSLVSGYPARETCSEHLVLLQWGNTIASSVLSTKTSSAGLSRTPHLSYTAPCDELDTALSDLGGLNTEMVLSSDTKLLGLVFQGKLHVWDVWSGRDVSCVDLPHAAIDEPFEELRLFTLGHLITIVGLEYSTGLLLVLTQTGQVVTQCDSFAQQHSRMTPPYTELLCVNEEAWVSDITTPCTTQRCVVTYWNKTNRSLEAVLLGENPVTNDNHPPARVSRKKSRWKIWK